MDYRKILRTLCPIFFLIISIYSAMEMINSFIPLTTLLFVFMAFALNHLFKSKLLGNVDQKAKKPSLPPGPKPWPIVGNLPEMIKSKEKTSVSQWIHKLMKELNTEIACFRFGKVHVITVTCPEISQEILKKQDAIFSSRPLTMGSEVLSRGYLTTAVVPFGDQWKKMKRIMVGELFSQARLRWLHEKRVEEADNLVRYVHNQCSENADEGGLVNLRAVARHYCGNVIRKLVFNTRYFGEGKDHDGGPGAEEVEHVHAIFTILAHLYSFCISDYVPWLRGFDLEGHEKTLAEATRVVAKYHDPIIDERIQQWREGKKEQPEDLLDVLVSLKDDNGDSLLSPEEIKAQIMEIMVAAVDNPSNALEWALAEMLNQPEMLQKAKDELDTVVKKERLVQESDFPKLNYIKACAREAFRLHPIDPFNVPHMSVADTTVGNYFIPKGSHVLLSRLGLGRNPKVWDEPSKFKPERHFHEVKEVVLREPDLRLLSFSRGRRGCMGVVLGSSMTLMLFARLLHGFSWSIPSNEGSIDLSEGKGNLHLARPLVAVAKPRLLQHVYPC